LRNQAGEATHFLDVDLRRHMKLDARLPALLMGDGFLQPLLDACECLAHF
jgi:hypothetical protein